MNVVSVCLESNKRSEVIHSDQNHEYERIGKSAHKSKMSKLNIFTFPLNTFYFLFLYRERGVAGCVV